MAEGGGGVLVSGWRTTMPGGATRPAPPAPAGEPADGAPSTLQRATNGARGVIPDSPRSLNFRSANMALARSESALAPKLPSVPAPLSNRPPCGAEALIEADA